VGKQLSLEASSPSFHLSFVYVVMAAVLLMNQYTTAKIGIYNKCVNQMLRIKIYKEWNRLRGALRSKVS
jgi:hypothetical protein